MSVKKKMTRKCDFCGKEFETARNYQKYCCKHCREEMSKSLSRQKTQEKHEKKNKGDGIVNVAIAARQLGMSYGQYQAMQMLKGSEME